MDRRERLAALPKEKLIELIEFGGGLPLSPNTKRLMETLSRSAASEFATLSKLEKS